MIAFKPKLWRTLGVAAAFSLTACGEGGQTNAGGEGGGEGGEGGGEAGEAAATAPVTPGATAPAAGGGEAGEAGAASAYAGVSGDQLTALRIQHLKGFVMAAARVVEENKPVEAGVLVAQGLLEVYDAAPTEFGGLNVDIIRAAADSNGLNRAQMMQRIRAADAELVRAASALEIDDAALVARMIDISTGLYQGVIQADFVDPIEYQHSMGAALAAQDALLRHQDALRQENLVAYSRAQGEMNRFVALWRAPEAPEAPTPYNQVLAQGSRVRLALSPFL